MPDWLTHIGIAYLLSKFARRDYSSTRLALVGSILPDLPKQILRPLDVAGYSYDFKVNYFFEPFHSVFGVILIPLFISLVYHGKDGRIRSFMALVMGYLSHLIVDSVTFFGIRFLAPISWTSYSLGLIWPENLTPTAVVVTAVVAYHLASRHRGSFAYVSI